MTTRPPMSMMWSMIALLLVLALAGCDLDSIGHEYTCTATALCGSDVVELAPRQACFLNGGQEAEDWFAPIARREADELGCSDGWVKSECDSSAIAWCYPDD